MNEVLKNKYSKVYEYHKAKHPTSRVLVCVAGVSEGAFRWYESLPILTEEFNVVLFNNPAVDGAPDKITFTVEEQAEEYQHILNLLGIEEYYLMGHSMGGFISQRMVLNNPHKINKLVLIGTSFGSFQSEIDVKNIMDTKNTLKNSLDNFKSHHKLVRMQDYSFTEEFQNAHPDIIEKYLDEKTNKYKLAKRVLVSHFVCGGRFSSVGETHKITCPTLVIHGTKDRMVNVTGGERLAKTIPNSTLWKIEGAGHTPFIEDVNIMISVVNFLIYDRSFGDILDKDYTITPEMLEKDQNFRAHSRPITYSNFFKELFMMDDLEVKIDKYLDIIKGKY
jgi:pimeloyl-ACP methyl ester carboxylesterase